MSNPVEIGKKALHDAFRNVPDDVKDYDEYIALAIIVALEKEGYKVVHRQPTVEMNCAAWSLVRDRWPKGQFMGPGPAFREVMAAMFDAAPRYGEPSKQ